MPATPILPHWLVNEPLRTDCLPEDDPDMTPLLPIRAYQPMVHPRGGQVGLAATAPFDVLRTRAVFPHDKLHLLLPRAGRITREPRPRPSENGTLAPKLERLSVSGITQPCSLPNDAPLTARRIIVNLASHRTCSFELRPQLHGPEQPKPAEAECEHGLNRGCPLCFPRLRQAGDHGDQAGLHV